LGCKACHCEYLALTHPRRGAHQSMVSSGSSPEKVACVMDGAWQVEWGEHLDKYSDIEVERGIFSLEGIEYHLDLSDPRCPWLLMNGQWHFCEMDDPEDCRVLWALSCDASNPTMAWVRYATLKNVLLKDPDFGAFSIFMCVHVYKRDSETGERRKTIDPISLFIKLLPLSIIVVQVAAPVSLFAAQYHDYNKGWCPSTGPPDQRVLMSCVALLYFVRSLFMNSVKCLTDPTSTDDIDDTSEVPSLMNPDLQETEKNRRKWNLHKSILRDYALIDRALMNFAYEPLLMLLNLWLVFIADDALDIVLNSLAMEFVAQIDDEFKEQFFQLIGNAFVESIMKNELKEKSRARVDERVGTARQQLDAMQHNKKDSSPCVNIGYLVLPPLGLGSMAMLSIVSFVMFFYGAACKP